MVLLDNKNVRVVSVTPAEPGYVPPKRLASGAMRIVVGPNVPKGPIRNYDLKAEVQLWLLAHCGAQASYEILPGLVAARIHFNNDKIALMYKLAWL